MNNSKPLLLTLLVIGYYFSFWSWPQVNADEVRWKSKPYYFIDKIICDTLHCQTRYYSNETVRIHNVGAYMNKYAVVDTLHMYSSIISWEDSVMVNSIVDEPAFLNQYPYYLSSSDHDYVYVSILDLNPIYVGYESADTIKINTGQADVNTDLFRPFLYAYNENPNDVKNPVAYPLDSIEYIKFSHCEDGILKLDGLDSLQIVSSSTDGKYVNGEWVWSNPKPIDHGILSQTLTPLTNMRDLVNVPDNLEFVLYGMSYRCHNDEWYDSSEWYFHAPSRKFGTNSYFSLSRRRSIWVAIDGDDVYVRGLCAALNHAVIKGKITDQGWEFAPFQFLGMVGTRPFFACQSYGMENIEVNRDDELDNRSSYLVKLSMEPYPIVFKRNDNGGYENDKCLSMAYVDSPATLEFHDKYYLYIDDAMTDIVIKEVGDKFQSPAPPSLYYGWPPHGRKGICVDMTYCDTNGALLRDYENVYLRLVIDGEPRIYDGYEEIPYDVIDVDAISLGDDFDDDTEIVAETIYYHEGERIVASSKYIPSTVDRIIADSQLEQIADRDVVFDLMGRQMNVNSLQPGIYISNGKKFIIK